MDPKKKKYRFTLKEGLILSGLGGGQLGTESNHQTTIRKTIATTKKFKLNIKIKNHDYEVLGPHCDKVINVSMHYMYIKHK